MRADVDDDVHSEERHAELRAQLSDQRRHGLRAGGGEVGHLLVQLGGETRRPCQVRPSAAVMVLLVPRPGITAVRSELDSGLDTWWLLKKIVFLSAHRAHSPETDPGFRGQRPKHGDTDHRVRRGSSSARASPRRSGARPPRTLCAARPRG